MVEALARAASGTARSRCAGLATPWGADDLAAAARARPDALVLPKVESAAQVHAAEAALAGPGRPRGSRLWCMIETPRGVLAAPGDRGRLAAGLLPRRGDERPREGPRRARTRPAAPRC